MYRILSQWGLITVRIPLELGREAAPRAHFPLPLALEHEVVCSLLKYVLRAKNIDNYCYYYCCCCCCYCNCNCYCYYHYYDEYYDYYEYNY